MKIEDKIQEAVLEVRKLIEQVVRHEQLIDSLTRLPNDVALSEAFEENISEGKPFWCAFIEVDHFKRINERFGYESSDGLLKRIASHLNNVKDFFPHGARAFRAHGDEFFIVGAQNGESVDTISSNLENIRVSVEAISIPVTGIAENMNCTVSIGWLLSEDAGEGTLTSRSIRLLLQDAVSFAKRKGRNCTVRYTGNIRELQIRSIRDNCRVCDSAFTVDIPLDKQERGDLFCPNCGATIQRPPTPNKPPDAKRI